jgi:hypothetical protein
VAAARAADSALRRNRLAPRGARRDSHAIAPRNDPTEPAMRTTSRIEAAFTATLSAALLALGATAFATVERGAAPAVPVAQATLPTVTVVGKRPTVQAAAAQTEGSTARKAS